MAVTIKELSAYCHLSVSTVSKALNGYSDVSEETKALVMRAAQQLGYHPSAVARSLKTGRSFNLGVLYSDATSSGFTHSYFSPILQSFKEEAERLGYDITFITHHIGSTAMTYLEHCRYRNVDGVCIVCCEFTDPEVLELIASPIPVVTIDHVFEGKICIQSENRQGMEDLVRHILALGHRRVAYISGEERDAVSKTRVDSYIRAMREAGIEPPPEYLVSAMYHHPASTREATKRLLALERRPTCIMMPDDYAALGGLEAIAEAGLRVPEDISVAAYDGVPLLQLCQPRLLTVEQDTARIGSEAACRLAARIENPEAARVEIVSVPCRLLPGMSIRNLNE